MAAELRPTPVRDEVIVPVSTTTAVVAFAMFLLHLILDRYADPAQYGDVWGWVQAVVEASIVTGAAWWQAHRSAKAAEALVTPLSDPQDYEGRHLVPDTL